MKPKHNKRARGRKLAAQVRWRKSSALRWRQTTNEIRRQYWRSVERGDF